jgi:hypothetical protein
MCRSLSVLVLAVCLLTIPVSADLVGWWKFDDGSGSTAADSSGRGQDGTLTNDPTWSSAGVYGGCLQFDGTNDRVVVNGSWTLAQYTVSMWFRQDGGTGVQRDIVSMEDASGGHGTLLEIGTNGTLRFLHRAPMATTGGAATESLYSPTAPATGTWHHAAAVKTATDMVMYIDGVQVATQANAGTFDGTVALITIGDIDNRQMRPWPGLIDDVRLYNTALTEAEVQQVRSNTGNRGYATSPRPGDKAKDVPRETALIWKPGEFAVAHDVYLGTSADDIANATRANPLGVLAKQALDVNTYDPAGRFEFGQTYYWRVDEVNAAPSSKIFTGSVWSFTVEPYSYEVTGVTATASGSGQASTGPEKTVDGSGLNANGEHGTAAEDGWLSGPGFPQWIQYTFDKVYKLDKMWVWNSNQALENLFGFGAKDVLVQYSVDGATWTDLGNFVFNQAPGSPDYIANTDITFGGVPAKYVKLTISSSWGGILPGVGLSEVRFYSIPVAAREPSPADEATNVYPQVPFSWRAGREAASHEVYLSTDPNAVADDTASKTTVSQAKYDAAVDLEKTYYWKVVEVNEAETPSAWISDVWSFTAATYISVDDFESYTNDSPKRVFQTWIDGAGFSPDEFFPNGNDGNGTGSLVGYDPTLGDIMQTTYFYGGRQSMPLYYDNSAAPRYSEAVRTLDPAKDMTDWTRHGITTLVLYFYGDPANSGAPLYVKINNTKRLYNDSAVATTAPFWKPFRIDLASVPASDLKNVKTLTIGVGDGSTGGSGTMFIDDIQLYRVAPPVPTEQLWIEAESATPTVPAPWVISDDPLASGGKYITTPSTTTSSTANPPTSGVATYNFTVAGGAYKLWFRLGPVLGYDNDSLWIRIKDATIDPTGNAANPGWIRCNGLAGQAGAATWHLGAMWDDEHGSVQVTFTLPAGNHTLEVGYREPAVALDAILITN